MNTFCIQVIAQVYNGGTEPIVVAKVCRRGQWMPVMYAMLHINVPITTWCRVLLGRVQSPLCPLVNVPLQNIGYVNCSSVIEVLIIHAVLLEWPNLSRSWHSRSNLHQLDDYASKYHYLSVCCWGRAAVHRWSMWWRDLYRWNMHVSHWNFLELDIPYLRFSQCWLMTISSILPRLPNKNILSNSYFVSPCDDSIEKWTYIIAIMNDVSFDRGRFLFLFSPWTAQIKRINYALTNAALDFLSLLSI